MNAYFFVNQTKKEEVEKAPEKATREIKGEEEEVAV
jgi:YHS domain-containing protein